MGVVAGYVVRDYGGRSVAPPQPSVAVEDRCEAADLRSRILHACRYGRYCDDNEEDYECGASYVCRELGVR